MRRRSSRNLSQVEGLRRKDLILRYAGAPAEAFDVGDPAADQAVSPSPDRSGASEYVAEFQVTRGYLWRWSLFEVIDLGGDGFDPPLKTRSLEAVASARRPYLSERAAMRAAEDAARAAFAARAPTEQPLAVGAQRSLEPPRLGRRLVLLALLLLAAGALAGAVAVTHGSRSHDAASRRHPLRPPRVARTARTKPPARLPIRTAERLNNEGYAKMRSGDYAGALPLLERAVGRLTGTGSLDEAYADFNLAYTRVQLGKCFKVSALLDRSQRLQGERIEIDALRVRAERACA